MTGPFRRFRAVLVARTKEFLRDRSAVAWNLAMPFILVFGFGFVFSGDGEDLFKVAVVGTVPEDREFFEIDHVQFVEVDDRDATLEKLRRHQFDLVVEPGDTPRYWINGESPKGGLVERILWSAEGKDRLVREVVTGRPIRYVDWLVPGLIGLNMMFSCLFGVGYVVVEYRKNGVLRRFKATPLSALEFLAAQVGSRWLIVMVVSSIIYFGSDLAIDLPMNGSLAVLFLLFGFGAACHVALGILVAARTSSEELAGGLLNLASWPMMLLSGVWFSLEGAPAWVRTAAQVLPLTHVIDGVREVMIDGAGLAAIGVHLGVLAAASALFLLVGAATFRWE